MRLAEALAPLLPEAGPAVVALVGAGGKTRALFTLGEELAPRVPDAGVALTTTTHILDPRHEPGRVFDRVVLDPALGQPAGAGAWDPGPAASGRGERVVFAARVLPGEPKLQGIHPARAGDLARAWPYVVVEADGAKRHPVKAPGPHEPVMPAGAGLVLGIIGLDCLGRPLDADTVHRPERFGPLAGCAPGAPLALEHLAALAAAPDGLFRNAPAGARRALLLNKADLCPADPRDLAARLAAALAGRADLVLVGALADPDPGRRVLARAVPGV